MKRTVVRKGNPWRRFLCFFTGHKDTMMGSDVSGTHIEWCKFCGYTIKVEE